MFRIGESIETERRLMVAGSGGRGNGKRLALGTGFLFEVRKTFCNYIVMMVAQLCKYAKSHWIECFRWVNCMVCELEFNQAAENVLGTKSN